jgi:hypothetical protein
VFKVGRSPALLAADFDDWLITQAKPATATEVEVDDELAADRAELLEAGVVLRGPASEKRPRAAKGGRR